MLLIISTSHYTSSTPLHKDLIRANNKTNRGFANYKNVVRKQVKIAAAMCLRRKWPNGSKNTRDRFIRSVIGLWSLSFHIINYSEIRDRFLTFLPFQHNFSIPILTLLITFIQMTNLIKLPKCFQLLQMLTVKFRLIPPTTLLLVVYSHLTAIGMIISPNQITSSIAFPIWWFWHSNWIRDNLILRIVFTVSQITNWTN